MIWSMILKRYICIFEISITRRVFYPQSSQTDRKCQFVSVQLAPLLICNGRDVMDEITTLRSSLECLAEFSGNKSINGLIQRCMPHRMLEVESVNSASLVILLIHLVTLSFTYSSTYSCDPITAPKCLLP